MADPAPPNTKARLARFRALIVRLGTGEFKAETLERYVDRPENLGAVRLARRIEIEPTAALMLVGGIGSGKTTELRRLQTTLGTLTDVRPFYVDVSALHDLGAIETGTLLACVALSMLPVEVPEGLETVAYRVRELSGGYWRSDDTHWGYEPPRAEFVPGLLRPRVATHDVTNHVSLELLAHISKILEAGGPNGIHVALVDSLDRLIVAEGFTHAIRDDIAALRHLGVGIVVTAPVQVLFGTERNDDQLFDDWHHLKDVEPAGTGLSFLLEVLQRRDDDRILTGDALHLLARYSGGVMRDLIALAKSATQEAYLRGDDAVSSEAVHAAADVLGRQRLLGLDGRSLDVLRRLESDGTFAPTTDHDVALVTTRRVLLYEGVNGIRYAVHPCLLPLLDAAVT